jgi:hypothetical protein
MPDASWPGMGVVALWVIAIVLIIAALSDDVNL